MSDYKNYSREEIAKIEIGHTESTRPINVSLTLFFIATITIVPLLQMSREFTTIRAGKESGRSLPQSFDVFSLLQTKDTELKAREKEKGGVLAAGSRVNNQILGNIQRYETDLKERDEG